MGYLSQVMTFSGAHSIFKFEAKHRSFKFCLAWEKREQVSEKHFFATLH